jgi:hypothetical protein
VEPLEPLVPVVAVVAVVAVVPVEPLVGPALVPELPVVDPVLVPPVLEDWVLPELPLDEEEWVEPAPLLEAELDAVVEEEEEVEEEELVAGLPQAARLRAASSSNERQRIDVTSWWICSPRRAAQRGGIQTQFPGDEKNARPGKGPPARFR